MGTVIFCVHMHLSQLREMGIGRIALYNPKRYFVLSNTYCGNTDV